MPPSNQYKSPNSTDKYWIRSKRKTNKSVYYMIRSKLLNNRRLASQIEEKSNGEYKYKGSKNLTKNRLMNSEVKLS